MSEKKTDRRVRRTQKMLRAALVELMKEKRVQEITVREISELADFNRGTFYLHYKDVFDMVDRIEEELIEELERLLEQFMPQEEGESVVPMLRRIFEFLKDNADIGRVLLGPNGDLSFVSRVKVLVRNRMLTIWPKIAKTTDTAYLDYFASYIVSGFVGLFEAWLAHDMKESPQEMAELAKKMVVMNLEPFQV